MKQSLKQSSNQTIKQSSKLSFIQKKFVFLQRESGAPPQV
jgi:hypothetical protein